MGSKLREVEGPWKLIQVGQLLERIDPEVPWRQKLKLEQMQAMFGVTVSFFGGSIPKVFYTKAFILGLNFIISGDVIHSHSKMV